MALYVSRIRPGLLLGRLSGVVETQKALVVGGGCVRMPVACLTATYGGKFDYPAPFDYENKRYWWYRKLFEQTADRFNDNSKVVVVEGNIGIGKTEFAKRLAKEFDLKFFPPTHEIECWTANTYKMDIRCVDPLLPPNAKSYDLRKFYSDPHPENCYIGRLQLVWYEMKFYAYLKALQHLLSTGQGVVLVRSVYSDSVFVDALHSMGWISSNFLKYYDLVRSNSICDLYRPHLHIYLDAPIDVIRERINKRNDPIEVGSRNLTDDYLRAIEKVYQQKYLPKMRASGEVVEIDWSEIADDNDMDAIAEELQMIRLEGEDNDDPKFSDWAREDSEDWTLFRQRLDKPVTKFFDCFDRGAPWDCPELLLSYEDKLAVANLAENHPAFKYEAGWAPEFGHSTLLKM
jgi:NADH dehydrogenase (ubiquinone) 1 alpha subcomplex subunit 10